MKKIILIGRSECGKTSLTQALRGEKIVYKKMKKNKKMINKNR